MSGSKSWMIHLVIAIGFIYHHLITTSLVGAASTYNFIANQRPRFQIPHGNLSYYRSPQWEVLYYLKFGVFPFYSSSSPYLNRTQYLNKIRLIKNLMDRKGEDTVAVGPGNDMNEMEHNGSDSSSVGKLTHQPLNLVDRPPEPASRPRAMEVKKMATNFYYPLASFKKNVHPAKGKRDGSSETLNGFHSFEQNFMDRVYDIIDYDYFLVGGDPRWLRNRVGKQIGIGGGRGLYSGGDGGAGFDGMGPGSMSAEMTIERKVGRKFQTQGWKK